MKIKAIFCWVLFALAVHMIVVPHNAMLSVYWVAVAAYWAYSAWELEKNR